MNSTDLKLYLTGGASNADPNLSLGGTASSIEWTGGNVDDLFDDISADKGVDINNAKYRSLAVKNTHGSDTVSNLVLWLSQLSSSQKTEIAIWVTATTTAVANENTAPAASSFTSPTTQGTGLSIGTLAPAATYRIWFKRTVSPTAKKFSGDSVKIKFAWQSSVVTYDINATSLQVTNGQVIQGTWAELRAKTTGTAPFSGTQVHFDMANDTITYGMSNANLNRSVLNFNTTTIPTASLISAARLVLANKTVPDGTVRFSPPIIWHICTSLVSGSSANDFNIANFGTESLATGSNTGTFTLSSAASVVKNDGVNHTRLGMRWENDMLNVTPNLWDTSHAHPATNISGSVNSTYSSTLSNATLSVDTYVGHEREYSTIWNILESLFIDYINLLTSQYQLSDNIGGWLSMPLSKLTDIVNAVNTFDAAFDIDTAIGNQLDILGDIIGFKRRVNFTPSFSVDPVLDDTTYRAVLKARIAFNHWDGKRDSLYASWSELFPTGEILIYDSQLMMCVIGMSGSYPTIIQDLINNGYIVPKPQGVKYYYGFGDLPFFGFDLDNDFVSGFDVGHII